MVQLPSYADLGQVSPQPVAAPDVPISVAEEVGTAQAGFGKAVQGVGEGMQKEDFYEGALQQNYAKSALLTRQAQLEDQLKDDPDYANISKKYDAGMQKIISDTSGMVTDPSHQNMFQAYAQKEAFAVGQMRMDSIARQKRKQYTLSSIDQASQNNMNVALTAPDEATAMTALGNTNDLIDSAAKTGALDPAHAYEIKSKNATIYAKARLAALPGSQQIALLSPYINSMRGGQPSSQPVAPVDGSQPADAPRQAAFAEQGGSAPANSNIPTDFDGSANYVISKFEGTHVNPNDGGYGPSKFGIVGAHNGLTPEQTQNLTQPQATQIYKKNYWDAIGADSLPANMRLAAFDTAVNFGVPAAKDMLAQAGNDPQKLLDLRQQAHASIVQSNPAHAGDAAGWQSRDNMLGRDLGITGNAPAATHGSFLDFIPRQDIPQLYNEAHGKAEREGVVARSALDVRLNNANTMALNGVADPNPPSPAEFQAAYGDTAPAAIATYQKTQMLAHNLKAVQTMAPQQMEDMLKQAEPTPGSPTYDIDVQRRDVLAKAIVSVNNQRNADPVSYGQQNGLIDPKPIDLSDPKNLAQQLQARTAAVQSMAQSYGTPMNIFSKPEAQFIAKQMDTLPTANKLGLLSTMAVAIPDPKVYQAALDQIRPNSPVTAMAGNYVQLGNTVSTTHWFKPDDVLHPQDVAANLIAGDNILHPTKGEKAEQGQGKPFPMPEDGTPTQPGLRGAFNDVTGDLYRGMPQAADFNYQAFRALYAKNASDAGNYTGVMDSDIAQKSLKQLMGTEPVSQANGSKALPPWGMQPSDFNDAKAMAFDHIKAKNPDTLAKVDQGSVSLLNTGTMGQYLMQVGNGFVVGKDGQPLVMDLSQPMTPGIPTQPITDAVQPKEVVPVEPTSKEIPHRVPNKRGQ